MNPVQLTRRVGQLVLLLLYFTHLPVQGRAADEPAWSKPKNLSDWQFLVERAVLAQNDNGVVAVLWPQIELTPPNNTAMMARVRSPSGSWSNIENITGFIPKGLGSTYLQFKVAPNGTVWMAWVYNDGSAAEIQVFKRKDDGGWQGETASSYPAQQIRGMDLDIGPDGDIGLIWVDCSTPSTDYTKGGCGTISRRQSAAGSSWENEEVLDNSPNGIAWPSIRVGPNGMMVAAWTRFESTPDWKIQSKACSTPTTAWQPIASDVSSPVEPYNPDSPWISDPMMTGDGTFVLAWYHRTGPNISLKSATRMAASSFWTVETDISANYPAYSMEPPMLATGMDGTVAASWVRVETASWRHAAYANVRDAGGTWGATGAQLSGWLDNVTLSDLKVLDDGRTIVLWKKRDTVGTPKNEAVSWAHRAKSGNWNIGQVSNWTNTIVGSALAGTLHDNVSLVWADEDSSLPTAEAYAIRTTTCSLTHHYCNPPTLFAGGYKGAALYSYSVGFNSITPSASVSWLAMRDTVNMYIDPSYGVFFSQWPKPFPWLLYYPAVIKEAN